MFGTQLPRTTTFGLGGAAQFRVERSQRQSSPQREFQARGIVQSKAMTPRQMEGGSPGLPVRLRIDVDRQEVHHKYAPGRQLRSQHLERRRRT